VNNAPDPWSGARAVGAHQMAPLSFDPARLRGLSEGLIVSHHQNNYGGTVRNLNKVEAEIAALPADAPGYRVAGLRGKELAFANSKRLHEAYFGNLGGDGQPAGAVAKALDTGYGGRATWESALRAAASGLAGGSGWVMVVLTLPESALRIVSSGDHTQAAAAAVPLLVLDMYEHSYHLDYGAGAMRYVDAFFQNVEWETIDRRFAHAQAAAVALRGA